MGIKLQLKSARELKAKPVAPAAAVSDPPPPPANDVTFADDKLEEEEKKDDIVAAERKIGPHGHGHKKKELETEGGDTTATVAHKGHDEEDDICSSKPAHAHTTKLKDDFVEPTTKPGNNNNIGMVHYHDDNDDHDSTYVGFDRLFGCFGFGSEDYTASYMSCSTNTEELEKLQEETAEALARKKLEKAVIEASKVEKALAAEKAQRLRDIAKEKNAAIKAANEGKKKAWRVAALRRKQQGAAREAAITHYTQAVIKADEAQKASEMKSDKADEVRRRVEKAKVAIKLAKTEAKGAKKIAIKEGKVVERTLKELRVVTAQANAARRKFTKFETAAAKKVAKEEAKRAAATRKLVQKMEEEEKQIRNAEIKIRNLREQMKDADAIFGMKRIGGGGGGDNDIETDLTLTSTKDDTIATEYESGNFRDVEDLGPSLQHDIEDMGSLLSDMMDEASILLGRK